MAEIKHVGNDRSPGVSETNVVSLMSISPVLLLSNLHVTSSVRAALEVTAVERECQCCILFLHGLGHPDPQYWFTDRSLDVNRLSSCGMLN